MREIEWSHYNNVEDAGVISINLEYVNDAGRRRLLEIWENIFQKDPRDVASRITNSDGVALWSDGDVWGQSLVYETHCAHKRCMSFEEFVKAYENGELFEYVEPEKDEVDEAIKLLQTNPRRIGINLSSATLEDLLLILEVCDIKVGEERRLSAINCATIGHGTDIKIYTMGFDRLAYNEPMSFDLFMRAIRRMSEQQDG